jgi:hypothetical protein
MLASMYQEPVVSLPVTPAFGLLGKAPKPALLLVKPK